jgi:hypothetical protein
MSDLTNNITIIHTVTAIVEAWSKEHIEAQKELARKAGAANVQEVENMLVCVFLNTAQVKQFDEYMVSYNNQ